MSLDIQKRTVRPLCALDIVKDNQFTVAQLCEFSSYDYDEPDPLDGETCELKPGDVLTIVETLGDKCFFWFKLNGLYTCGSQNDIPDIIIEDEE